MKLILIILCLSVGLILNGCSRPPDLDAPCREFGKYCAQLPINVEPIHKPGEKA